MLCLLRRIVAVPPSASDFSSRRSFTGAHMKVLNDIVAYYAGPIAKEAYEKTKD